MRLSDKHIDRFIDLYEKKYGVRLERQDAIMIATKLLSFIQVVESHMEKAITK